MRKMLICICCGLFSTAVLAEVPVNAWLERVEDRGSQIEFIRVTSERTLVATPDSDTDIERILSEVEAIEEQEGEETSATTTD